MAREHLPEGLTFVFLMRFEDTPKHDQGVRETVVLGGECKFKQDHVEHMHLS
jgi:hypothetical protein